MTELAKITRVTNDTELRQALKQLSTAQKREIGVLFIDEVKHLITDKRIQDAIGIAHDKDASENDLEAAFLAVKKAMIDSYTRCGADSNWDDQAEHFVAKAVMALLTPKTSANTVEPLWQVVQSCRMARICGLIAADDDSPNPEAEKQYQILNEFLCVA